MHPYHHHKNSAIALYSSKQLYAIEQAWFGAGHDSFGLMQQAAWQMTKHIERLYERQYSNQYPSVASRISDHHAQYRASVWVGKGNNGGDGWLIAYYLEQAGWQVQIITVGFEACELQRIPKSEPATTDAIKAKERVLAGKGDYQRFEESNQGSNTVILQADVYIDALFGIGLVRPPKGVYRQAIAAFNEHAAPAYKLAIAVDMPSGVVATTGEVFDDMAIQADATLCLIARKLGLHIKDGVDHSGQVLDIPLIPYPVGDVALEPIATLITAGDVLSPRRQNSHKGRYGHVLIIGGNRIDGSQGMGGAAILSASSAMATGAGKITVACHQAFHGALLTSLPDAMTLNLHDLQSVQRLINEAAVVAIGMGLGRDDKAMALFISYTQAAITANKPLIIDADGLYHLATLQTQNHQLVTQLRDYSMVGQVCFTPHSGEAAKLLDKKVHEIESDKLSAIKQCAQRYGGDWVLKGCGSLVLEHQLRRQYVYVCAVGNAGMATAGMGDVLSGVMAGLLAQPDLQTQARRLHQAVVLHGLAGDVLVDHSGGEGGLAIGQRSLQAQDMPAAIGHVMQQMTKTR